MSNVSQATLDAAAIVTLETRLGVRRGAPVSRAAARRIFDEARAMSPERRARVIDGLRSALVAFSEISDGTTSKTRSAA